jgi:hypothetical protein
MLATPFGAGPVIGQEDLLTVTQDEHGLLHISQAELDEWLTRELARDPYGRVSAEVILYGAPRLFMGRAYVIDQPDLHKSRSAPHRRRNPGDMPGASAPQARLG